MYLVVADVAYQAQVVQRRDTILYDKVQIAKAVNVAIISLDEAPKGYTEFDSGVAKKFVINPHSLIPT